jgi:predicted transcriptional regulator
VLNKESITKICIDDFALKRGHRYGTVMVDIDSRRIIDMFESRASGAVSEWLAEYSNIEVVVRDGSVEYAAAIKQAHPDAIQVTDRFHLVKNLTDYAKKYIIRHIPSFFRIPTEVENQNVGDSFWGESECHGENFPEKQNTASTERKCAFVEQVRSLATKGLSVADISKEVSLSPSTVEKYLNAAFVPGNKQYGTKKTRELEPYMKKIDTMLLDRYTFKEIEAALREDGYKGSASIIQRYTTQQRKIMKAANAEALRNTEGIKRKWVIALLYHPIENIKNITYEQVERIFRQYPVIEDLYTIVRSFMDIMATQRVNDLDSWMENALRLEIKEITSFVKGIKRDLEAVKNAIALEYNNGLAEGSVNKLKLAKRIMYGRSSFETLRNKILLKEIK